MLKLDINDYTGEYWINSKHIGLSLSLTLQTVNGVTTADHQGAIPGPSPGIPKTQD
jgi:hypothetical protein